MIMLAKASIVEGSKCANPNMALKTMLSTKKMINKC